MLIFKAKLAWYYYYYYCKAFSGMMILSDCFPDKSLNIKFYNFYCTLNHNRVFINNLPKLLGYSNSSS